MIKKCQEGWADFDVAVATPEAMGEVRKLGKVLGPRGLMPNPKTGTVTEDTAQAVKEVKAGRVEFKMDKAGNVHVPVGKASFKPRTDRGKRPRGHRGGRQGAAAQRQGHLHLSCTLSATMSPPVRVDMQEFVVEPHLTKGFEAMRAEKQNLTKEYLARLNASPFFIVVNYKGLKVAHLTELRKRLSKAGAEIHVVKNSVFRIAAKEAGVGELNGALAGQLAVVTGQRDISTAAKVVKTFAAEFDRLKVQFGYLNNQRLEQAAIMTLADLPSLEVLRAKLLGLFNAPATKLVGPAEHAGDPDGAGHQGQVRKGGGGEAAKLDSQVGTRFHAQTISFAL